MWRAGIDLADWVLSVSSNGSWWVKPKAVTPLVAATKPFSILKRIVVGETRHCRFYSPRQRPFSILKRIVVGETKCLLCQRRWYAGSFSILKRIVVGETGTCLIGKRGDGVFQYPQTDRGG